MNLKTKRIEHDSCSKITTNSSKFYYKNLFQARVSLHYQIKDLKKQHLRKQQQQFKKYTDMKKVILFAAILFSFISIVNVQAQDVKTGTANLTLNLKAVQHINVSGNVTINYESADNYQNGVTSDDVTTLTVVSAGGFAIRVEAEDLKLGSTDKTIAASTIKVSAEAASANDNDAFDSGATLAKGGETKTALISSTIGGSNKIYTVSYTGDDNNAYLERYNSADQEETQTYTTVVTYTISAS